VWDEVNGGDGATTDIDPTNAEIQYAMNQYADSIAKRVGNGQFKCLGCGLPLACMNMHFQVHPSAPSTLLASCQSLLQANSPFCNICPVDSKNSHDPGVPNPWTVILPQSSVAGGVVRSAVDPSLNLYYAGTGGGQVLAGPGGANWRLIFSAAGMVSDIEVDRDDPAVVYVSFFTAGAGRVYRLRRSVAAPTPATVNSLDITFDLPTALAVKALAVDRMNPFTIYAATDRGVYGGRSADGGRGHGSGAEHPSLNRICGTPQWPLSVLP
jgi:hypothetical protein